MLVTFPTPIFIGLHFVFCRQVGRQRLLLVPPNLLLPPPPHPQRSERHRPLSVYGSVKTGRIPTAITANGIRPGVCVLALPTGLHSWRTTDGEACREGMGRGTWSVVCLEIDLTRPRTDAGSGVINKQHASERQDAVLTCDGYAGYGTGPVYQSTGPCCRSWSLVTTLSLIARIALHWFENYKPRFLISKGITPNIRECDHWL